MVVRGPLEPVEPASSVQAFGVMGADLAAFAAKAPVCEPCSGASRCQGCRCENPVLLSGRDPGDDECGNESEPRVGRFRAGCLHDVTHSLGRPWRGRAPSVRGIPHRGMPTCSHGVACEARAAIVSQEGGDTGCCCGIYSPRVGDGRRHNVPAIEVLREADGPVGKHDRSGALTEGVGELVGAGCV